MKAQQLEEYKRVIDNLSIEEKKMRDLYLRDIALGKIYGPLTGYPSIDKTWLKHYKEEYILADIPHMTAFEYLKQCNKHNLNSIAIDSEMGNYTYQELFNMIERVAASMHEMGIEREEVAIVMFPIAPHESFVMYGVPMAGGATSLLPPMTPVSQVCSAINMFKSNYYFTFDCFLDENSEKEIYNNTNLKHIISVGLDNNRSHDERTLSWDEFLAIGRGHECPDINRKPEELFFVAKTGGSTGIPKGVCLNDNCFNALAHQFLNSDVNYNPGDKWIRLWPLFSASAAVNNHHLPLCCGMNNLLRAFPTNIKDFDKMIIADKPNHIIMIPQLLDVLEQSELLKNERLDFVKTAGCGGLSITSQFEERVNKFYKERGIDTFLGYGWGCTEHSSNIAMRSNFETTQIGMVGAPMVNTTVAVFDPDTGEELPYETEGELCVTSPTIMMGYYNDPENTSVVIRIHADGRTWLHTRDLGIINENGLIKVTGRMTRVIFTFPTAKVYPTTLENDISKIEGVQEVAVCEMPDAFHEGFFWPVCFVVPAHNYNPEDVVKRVEQFCETAYAEDKRPKYVYSKDAMPLNTMRKPDILSLEQELREQTALTRKMPK